jgi:hypothetical protein
MSMALVSRINTTILHSKVNPKDPSVFLKFKSSKLKHRTKMPKARTKLLTILFIVPKSLKLLVEPYTQ